MSIIRYLFVLVYFDARRFFTKIAAKGSGLQPRIRLSSKDDFQSIMKDYYKNGFVVIPNYWTDHKCSSLVNELDSLFSDPSISSSLNEDIRIYDAQNYSKIAKDFFSDEQLQQVSKWATGLKLDNYGSMANRVEPNKSALGSGGDWHRDSNYCQFKTLIYLTDVSGVDDGAFQIITRSGSVFSVLFSNIRMKKKLTETRWTDLEIQRLGVSDKIRTVIGKAGTLVIFDTSNLHRGAANRNKFRYALTNYYYSNLVDQQYGYNPGN